MAASTRVCVFDTMLLLCCLLLSILSGSAMPLANSTKERRCDYRTSTIEKRTRRENQQKQSQSLAIIRSNRRNRSNESNRN